MILTGPEITREVAAGRIVIDPFSPLRVNPNSYNFRLAAELVVYQRFPIDPARPPETDVLKLPDGGLVLEPGRLYLGGTMERMGSSSYAPTYAARSSFV